ncbi:MAG: recombinase family protein [Candidatus Limnocylindrus sp.]
MFVAYYRVSTDRQGQSGLGLEAQRAAVSQHLAGVQPDAEFTEIESGRKADRPQLEAALAYARKHRATLVVAKLDRLARDVKLILTIVDSGVQVRFIDLPDIDTSTPVGRLMLTVMASLAEFEAARIGERTSAALQAAKARGVVLGCPTPDRGAQAVSDAARAYAETLRPVVEQIQASGARTLRDIAAQLQARSIKTSRGNAAWSPQQVANLLAHLQGECHV